MTEYVVHLDGMAASPTFQSVGEASSFRGKLSELMPDILLQRFTIEFAEDQADVAYSSGFEAGIAEAADNEADEIYGLERDLERLEDEADEWSRRVAHLNECIEDRDREIVQLLRTLDHETQWRATAEHQCDLQVHTIQVLQNEILRLKEAEAQ